MEKFILYIFPMLFALVGIVTSCDSKKNEKEEGVYYTCPMHPDVKKDEPGQCPVCNMDLVKKEDHHGHQH